MKNLKDLNKKELFYGALYIFAAIQMAIIGSAAIIGVLRVSASVMWSAFEGTFAAPEFLLVILVASIVSLNYQFYKTWRENKTLIYIDDYEVVAPCDRRFEK